MWNEFGVFRAVWIFSTHIWICPTKFNFSQLRFIPSYLSLSPLVINFLSNLSVLPVTFYFVPQCYNGSGNHKVNRTNLTEKMKFIFIVSIGKIPKRKMENQTTSNRWRMRNWLQWSWRKMFHQQNHFLNLIVRNFWSLVCFCFMTWLCTIFRPQQINLRFYVPTDIISIELPNDRNKHAGRGKLKLIRQRKLLNSFNPAWTSENENPW